MGCDPSATIFYGFYVNDERASTIRQSLILPDGDYEPDECLASLYGVSIPEFSGLDYWKQEQNFFLERVPIAVGIPFRNNELCLVAVRQSLQTALQCIQKLDPTKFVKQDDWDELLMSFCRRINIDCPQDKIGFWCMPDYG